MVFDVTDSKAVSAAVESILKTRKRIDVVVNNSGSLLISNIELNLRWAGVLLDAGTTALQFSPEIVRSC